MSEFVPDEYCEDCEQPTIVWKVSDHDENVYEYYCRNKHCGANWIEIDISSADDS